MNPTIVNQTKTRFPRVHSAKVLRFVWGELFRRRLVKTRVLPGLTLVFVSAKTSRKLNHQFRGKDRSTDVLSFAPLDESELGELVFCPQVLKKQALEQRHSFQAEYTYMLVHGLLHLLGFEHEQGGPAAQQMFELQDDLFGRFQQKG